MSNDIIRSHPPAGSDDYPHHPPQCFTERRIDELMGQLCTLWGTLDAGQCNRLEQSEVRRNVLSRIRAEKESNAVFLKIRQVFDIPHDVRIKDFGVWLEDALRRQRDIWEKEWADRRTHAPMPRIEAPEGEIKDATAFIVHGDE